MQNHIFQKLGKKYPLGVKLQTNLKYQIKNNPLWRKPLISK